MATFPGFGRIFDFTAQTCEKHLPQAMPLLRQARLFCFPHDPVGTLPKTHPPEEVEFWKDNFALPYPITAIEDPEGLVILWDSDVVQEPNWTETVRAALSAKGVGAKHDRHVAVSSLAPILACDVPAKGLGANRFFLDIVPSWTTSGRENIQVPITRNAVATDANDGTGDKIITVPDEFVSITLGVFNFDNVHTRGLIGNVKSMGYWSFTKRRRLFAAQDDRNGDIVLDQGAQSSLQNVRTAVEEIMWFNNPDRVVVEETRDQPPRPKNMKGKAKRAKERPTYHSWTPLDIRRLRGEVEVTDSEGELIKKRGHWRRGHFRTLRADRYARSGMQGKTILVRPAFIGDPTFHVERSHYRILLGEDEVLVGQQQESK